MIIEELEKQFKRTQVGFEVTVSSKGNQDIDHLGQKSNESTGDDIKKQLEQTERLGLELGHTFGLDSSSPNQFHEILNQDDSVDS